MPKGHFGRRIRKSWKPNGATKRFGRKARPGVRHRVPRWKREAREAREARFRQEGIELGLAGRTLKKYVENKMKQTDFF